MKQTPSVINLYEFTNKTNRPFGAIQGKETYRKLVDFIDSTPSVSTFGISLKDITATDASFPRESVVSVAKHYRGEKGFYLLDLTNRDLIDNWSYAALAKDQPLIIWNSDGSEFEFIGPTLKATEKALLEYIYAKETVTTSQLATDFGVSAPNASAKLKKASQQGYVLRTEEASESGGIEYIYRIIK